MYKFAILGPHGLVGKELLSLLLRRDFDQKEIKLLSREDPLDFSDVEVLFLCAGSKASKVVKPISEKQTKLTIDLSSLYRMESHVPLIIPSVNDEDLTSQNFVSSPNCIVSILLSVLGPLHYKNPIQNLFLSTYQAASGAGKKGLLALEGETKTSPFPHPLLYNLFPHESPRNKNGLCLEEEKIIEETRKILHAPNLPIHVRSVRVPVKRTHSISAIVSFTSPLSEEELKTLTKNPRIRLHSSPTPLTAEGKEEVLYAPIRKVEGEKNTYDFWIVGDQLLRGAALNALEIYDLWYC